MKTIVDTTKCIGLLTLFKIKSLVLLILLLLHGHALNTSLVSRVNISKRGGMDRVLQELAGLLQGIFQLVEKQFYACLCPSSFGWTQFLLWSPNFTVVCCSLDDYKSVICVTYVKPAWLVLFARGPKHGWNNSFSQTPQFGHLPVIQSFPPLHCTALNCTVLVCISLYCVSLFWAVLHCTVV